MNTGYNETLRKYIYTGPIAVFGRCVCTSWRAETYAQSVQRAMCNLKYQYAKQCNCSPNAITLIGEVREAT